MNNYLITGNQNLVVQLGQNLATPITISPHDPTQADLDWHNPEVRAALIDVVNFGVIKEFTASALT